MCNFKQSPFWVCKDFKNSIFSSVVNLFVEAKLFVQFWVEGIMESIHVKFGAVVQMSFKITVYPRQMKTNHNSTPSALVS